MSHQKTIQIFRTATANHAPPHLEEGELSVEMNSHPPRLWVGVPPHIRYAGKIQLNDPEELGGPWLPLEGGTLHGPLTVDGNATFRKPVSIDLQHDTTLQSYDPIFTLRAPGVATPAISIDRDRRLTIDASGFKLAPTGASFDMPVTFNREVVTTYSLGQWHEALGWKLFVNWATFFVAGGITISGRYGNFDANPPTGWWMTADTLAGRLRWIRDGQPWHQLIVANNQIRLESEDAALPLFQIASATGATFNVPTLISRDFYSDWSPDLTIKNYQTMLVLDGQSPSSGWGPAHLLFQSQSQNQAQVGLPSENSFAVSLGTLWTQAWGRSRLKDHWAAMVLNIGPSYAVIDFWIDETNVYVPQVRFSSEEAGLAIFNIHLLLNEGVTITPTADPPTNPQNGRLWHDSNDGHLKSYHNGTWRQMT